MASQKTASKTHAVEVTSLRKRRDFLRLRKARTYKCRYFIMSGAGVTEKDEPIHQARIGYTVTTKLGNAVVRNRIKRRLRAVTAAVLPEKGLHGFDYVVIARRAAIRAAHTDLMNEFSIALDHLHQNRSKG